MLLNRSLLPAAGWLALLCLGGTAATAAAERPNILWITCEDMSANLGCYGDKNAVTPHLDGLAKQGVRYTHAFAVAPVCAPTRSSLITGMYASSLGTHWMRCQGKLPDNVKCFPEYLRNAGYWCSNNVKTDYNFPVPKTAWNESSNKAHWRNRQAGQPFFSVFNLTTTHEGQVRTSEAAFAKHMARVPAEQRHDLAKVTVPPFYPDTPIIRRDLARYHDLITALDLQVADLLKQLDADGLADSTIVFFFSDHGMGLPRGKRWLYDTGLHVPLIIRFPERFKALAPGKPGTTTDRLVSFVDFGPTVLSLAGLEAPKHMQGSAFLGAHAKPPRDYLYFIRDRMDERNDFSRAVRDRRYKYIRNFMPHLPRAAMISYMNEMPTMQELRRLAAAGQLRGAAASFMQPTKQFEELYDTQADPFETRNLADSPEHQTVLHRFRSVLRDWAMETRDLGFLPEAMVHERCGQRPPYDVVRDPNNPLDLKPLLTVTDLLGKGPQAREDFLRLLDEKDAAVRYWAVVGLLALNDRKSDALAALEKALQDSSPSVRVAAADALAGAGRVKQALPVLRAALRDENDWVRHHAAEAFDRLPDSEARQELALLKGALTDKNAYVVRIIEPLVKRLEK